MAPRQRQSPPSGDGNDREISVRELRAHATLASAWIVIDDNVYDVTKFIPRHPGGRVIETQLGSPDATDVFEGFHKRKDTDKLLKKFRVGRLVRQGKEEERDAKAAAATADYRELCAKFEREGWFEASLSYSFVKVAVAYAFLAASIALLLLREPSAFTSVLAGVLVAAFLQQIALLGHDLSHNAVFDSFKLNDLVGVLVASIGFGMNSTQWKDEHNVHHAITNQVHQDLQFVYLPIWLLDEKELKDNALPWYAKILVKIQLFTFLPLSVLVGRVNLMFLSIVYTLGLDTKRGGKVAPDLRQGAALVAHYTWLIAVVFLLLDSPAHRWYFLAAMSWFSGILHIQLMISHVGTEMFFAHDQHNLEFVQFQLYSSRNINSNWATHWFHGGLQFQIEHHLFPRLPRNRLEDAKPYVVALAKKHGLPYMSDDFFAATADVLKHLHKTSKLVSFKN
jgi:acyl-lipid Delta6-acetylenase / acyl-lipid (9-3)-desaturase